MLDVIAFDADDTLWHNECLYQRAQERFKQLLAPYGLGQVVDQRLYQTEVRNLECFGYGIKAFTLSLIETAIELTGGRISGSEIGKIVGLAREMVSAQVELLEHAAETVAQLAASYPLMIVTKGDLYDQERKLARSGLGPHFRYVEIVTDKTQETYARLLARHRLQPARFLMVGNSLRSDVLPVLALGGQAVYVPYRTTWAHEDVPPPEGESERYHRLEHLGLLPALVERLSGAP